MGLKKDLRLIMVSEKIKNGLIFIGPPTSAKSSLAGKVAGETGMQVVRGRDVMPELNDRYGSFRELIPDDQFLPKLVQTLEGVQGDVIFDNIPRTERQALTLVGWARQQHVKLSLVKLNLTLEQVLDRVEGRMACPKCGETYHPILKPEQVSGKCNLDGEKLTKRQGDMSQAVVKNGYDKYLELVERLLKVLEGESRLLELDASGTVEETFQKLKREIQSIFGAA